MTGPQRTGLQRGTIVAQERAALRRSLREGAITFTDLLLGNAPEAVEVVALPMTLAQLTAATGHPYDQTRILDAAGADSMQARLRDLPLAARRRVADTITATGRAHR